MKYSRFVLVAITVHVGGGANLVFGAPTGSSASAKLKHSSIADHNRDLSHVGPDTEGSYATGDRGSIQSRHFLYDKEALVRRADGSVPPPPPLPVTPPPRYEPTPLSLKLSMPFPPAPDSPRLLDDVSPFQRGTPGTSPVLASVSVRGSPPPLSPVDLNMSPQAAPLSEVSMRTRITPPRAHPENSLLFRHGTKFDASMMSSPTPGSIPSDGVMRLPATPPRLHRDVQSGVMEDLPKPQTPSDASMKSRPEDLPQSQSQTPSDVSMRSRTISDVSMASPSSFRRGAQTSPPARLINQRRRAKSLGEGTRDNTHANVEAPPPTQFSNPAPMET